MFFADINEEFTLKERYPDIKIDGHNKSPQSPDRHHFNNYNYSDNTSSHDLTERLIRDGKLRKSSQINIRPGPLRKSRGAHSIGGDLNAMSVASLYQREGDVNDMDTERYVSN